MKACGDRVDCACCARIEELERERDEARTDRDMWRAEAQRWQKIARESGGEGE